MLKFLEIRCEWPQKGPQEEAVGLSAVVSACVLALQDCCLLVGTSVGERSGNLTFCDGGFLVCTCGIRPDVRDTRKISWPVYL